MKCSKRKGTGPGSSQPTELRPKVSAPPKFHGGVISWRFSDVDKGGPFSWTILENDPARFVQIIKKLSNLETMQEKDLGEYGCHSIYVRDLSNVAQKRLGQINRDDVDQLYSIRIDGRCRIFCIHDAAHKFLRVLWYDPEHEVHPSPKKHT